MKIIAIDSSGTVAAAAVADEKRLIAEFSLDNGMTHSQTLLPMLDDITRAAGVKMNEIDSVAVAGGPGSFTGLRIGSATAKGIGLAAGIPIVNVPTLEAMAYHYWGDDRLICPMMNARRGQVYTALYRFVVCSDGRCRAEAVLEQDAVDVREWCEKINLLGERVVLLGDGADDYRDILEETLRVPFSFAPLHMNRQRAGALACCAMTFLADGKTETAAQHRPVYLRKSQAEREREAAMKAAGRES